MKGIEISKPKFEYLGAETHDAGAPFMFLKSVINVCVWYVCVRPPLSRKCPTVNLPPLTNAFG